MKIRRSRTGFKEKGLTGTSQTTNTRRGTTLRRSNADLKSKTGRISKAKLRNEQTKTDLLPEQQSEKELGYNIRPCCVKIRRLKSEISSKVPKQTPEGNDSAMRTNLNIVPNSIQSPDERSRFEKSSGPSQAYKLNESYKVRRCCVKILRLNLNALSTAENQSKNSDPTRQKKQGSSSNEASKVTKSNSNLEQRISESTKMDIVNSPQENSSNSSTSQMNSRYSFRNPALALTRRRAQENNMVRPLTTELVSRDDNELNIANNCATLLEKSKNSTKHILAKSKQDGIDPSKETQGNVSQNLCNEPYQMSNISFSQNNNKNSNKESFRRKHSQPPKTVTNQRKNSKRDKGTTKLSRHGSSKEPDIYEYLSQSQTSGSESEKQKDPAADVIRKLIENGKVAVTRNYKGKPIVIHRKRNKKTALKQPLQINKKNPLKSRKGFQPTHAIINEDEEHVHLDEDLESPVENTEIMPTIPHNPNISEQTMKTKSNSTTAAASQGTFSSLARSVLMQQINQTNSTQKKVFDRKRLSEIRRIFSTPIRKVSSTITDATNLSPIPTLITDNENTQRNSSIDTIDFENNVSYRPSLPHVQFHSALPNESMRSLRSIQHISQQQSSLSSFSSNDSNAENMPPPSRVSERVLNDGNSIIFSARQTLNPRRTLPNRSPLKTINIIDVVTLPPYTGLFNKDKNDNLKINDEESQPHFDLDEYSNDDRSVLHEGSTHNNEETPALFGFEEYLDGDDSELHEESINNSKNITSSSLSNLHKKLKKLKKWRPSVPSYNDAKSSTITKRIFEDDFNKIRGHRDIRNMLCSTMINTASNKADNTTTATALDSSDDSDSAQVKASKGNVALDLFGDPESTFDQKSLHRTYERPFKRKRKLLHQYSVALDSEDESENEDEHNTSVTKKAKRPEKHRNRNEDEELENFISEFNSMIKEAEEYELIVE